MFIRTGCLTNAFLTVHGGGVFCKWVFITSFTVDIHFLIVKTTILVNNRLIEKRMYYLNIDDFAL